MFQPAPRTGRGTMNHRSRLNSNGFNPRARYGAAFGCVFFFLNGVSTRAPYGHGSLPDLTPAELSFNPRAPYGARIFFVHFAPARFQPTRPVRARRATLKSNRPGGLTHAPRTGRGVCAVAQVSPIVSTRAPTGICSAVPPRSHVHHR